MLRDKYGRYPNFIISAAYYYIIVYTHNFCTYTEINYTHKMHLIYYHLNEKAIIPMKKEMFIEYLTGLKQCYSIWQMQLTCWRVFSWRMSFSIVVNFKELLLFHVDVSLIWLNTLRKKKKSNSTFDVNCQKTSQVYSEFCASVWSFLKFISNNTQNSFSCQTENVHWHEIKVNA